MKLKRTAMEQRAFILLHLMPHTVVVRFRNKRTAIKACPDPPLLRSGNAFPFVVFIIAFHMPMMGKSNY